TTSRTSCSTSSRSVVLPRQPCSSAWSWPDGTARRAVRVSTTGALQNQRHKTQRSKAERTRRERMSSPVVPQAFENIRYEVRNHIAYVTIARPKVLNALNMATMGELARAFTVFREDANARVAI